jgi:hypothetical protein
MLTKRHYTPKLRLDLVRRLYLAAKAEGIPMTTLSNRFIEEALNRRTSVPIHLHQPQTPESLAA